MHSTNENKWTKIKKPFKQLGLTTQSHGIPKLFNTERTIIKIMWFLFTVGSGVVCIYNLVQNVNDYFQYPVITNINTINEMPTEFPAIEICPLLPTLKNYPIRDRIIKCIFNSVQNFSNDFELYYDYFFRPCLKFNYGRSLW